MSSWIASQRTTLNESIDVPVTVAVGEAGSTRVVVPARDDVGNDATVGLELLVDVPFRAAPVSVAAGDTARSDGFAASVAVTGSNLVVGTFRKGDVSGAAYLLTRCGGRALARCEAPRASRDGRF